MQATAHDVLPKLFVYPDDFSINRSRRIFTREMGILCAKRLMCCAGPISPLACSDSYSWQFSPFRVQVLDLVPPSPVFTSPFLSINSKSYMALTSLGLDVARPLLIGTPEDLFSSLVSMAYFASVIAVNPKKLAFLYG